MRTEPHRYDNLGDVNPVYLSGGDPLVCVTGLRGQESCSRSEGRELLGKVEEEGTIRLGHSFHVSLEF